MIRRWTIRTRLLLAYTLLFGIALSVFAWLMYETVKDERLSKLNTQLDSEAEKLHSEIEEQRDRHIFPIVSDLLSITTQGLKGERFQLYDLRGTLLIRDPLLAAATSFADAPADGVARRTRVLLDNVPHMILWIPLEIEGTNQYMLELAAPSNEIENDLARLAFFLIISIPVTLFLTGLAGSVISRSAFRPVSAMIDTANHITGTNLQLRIDEPSTQDEIQALARTLNSMIERIDRAFESQQQFIADASHELRTPLTVIRSELEFAQRSLTDPGALESLKIAFSELDRLARMAEGLLTLARMDASHNALKSDKVRLDELVVTAIQKMRTAADRNEVALDLHIESAIEIEGDSIRLESVFLNLLDNAIKFSPRGATVQCRLDAGSQTATVTVADSGPGLSREDQQSIFRRFYQTESARALGTGSGLGLAIVDKIVSLHHGTIEISSEPGKGTTVSVILPRRQPSRS